jgi:hypothetical protein
VIRYLSLAEYLWLTEQVTGIEAVVLTKAARIDLADSAGCRTLRMSTMPNGPCWLWRLTRWTRHGSPTGFASGPRRRALIIAGTPHGGPWGPPEDNLALSSPSLPARDGLTVRLEW